MNLKKLLSIILVVSLIFTSVITTVYAYSMNTLEEVYIDQKSGLKYSKIKILGKNENLYVEFSEPEKSLDNIISKNHSFIENISEYCNIPMLNETNWKEFRDAFYIYINENEILESSDEFLSMVEFFDIYENCEKNTTIKSYVSQNKLSIASVSYLNSLDTHQTETLNTLFKLLPSNSSLVEDINETIISSYASNINSEIGTLAIVKSFDTTKGIEYAEKYATSKNTPKYHYFRNGDCANFTSQILENGGVSQVSGSSSATGWWHTTKTILGITTHKHSESWSMADTFARYMGVSNKTKVHKTFAANVRAGDFITIDFTSDGDWEHMAFVTKKDTQVGSYGYIDYKVAQHTSDYYAWTSSDTNGWESYNNTGTYAIVRR